MQAAVSPLTAAFRSVNFFTGFWPGRLFQISGSGPVAGQSAEFLGAGERLGFRDALSLRRSSVGRDVGVSGNRKDCHFRHSPCAVLTASFTFTTVPGTSKRILGAREGEGIVINSLKRMSGGPR
jgi:hypothetical protein